MQTLAWIARLAVVIVLVWFAARNTQSVTLHGLPQHSWQAPLIFVVLVAFVGGVVIGLVAWLPTVVRQRRELARLRRPAPPPAAQSGPAAEPAGAPALPADTHGI